MNRSSKILRISAIVALSSIIGLNAYGSDHPPAKKDDHGAPADDGGHGEPAGHGEEGEGEHEAGVPENVILVIQPKKTRDPDVAADEVMRFYHLGEDAWHGGDFDLAERYFKTSLGIPLKVKEKEEVLSNMAKLYEKENFLPRASAILENLIVEFPSSHNLPDVNMKLGNIYRRMGQFNLANNKYFEVMTSSVNKGADNLAHYQQIAKVAMLRIAETYEEMQQYSQAFKRYRNLMRLDDLQPMARLKVHRKVCTLLFELKDYQQAVLQLKEFLKEYPESPHAAEMRYLIAKSYEYLNRKPEAIQEVFTILKRQTDPETEDPKLANYWRQKTGNELANSFYESADFKTALSLYQALARFDDNPEWRWPAVHQVGICFERLGLPKRAEMAYQEILNAEIPEEEMSESLRSLREMAGWRVEHLNWEANIVSRVQVLRAR